MVYWFIVAEVTLSVPQTSNYVFGTQIPVFRMDLGLPDGLVPDDCPLPVSSCL